jgi:proteasome lid subunit RPN8/RPN11
MTSVSASSESPAAAENQGELKSESKEIETPESGTQDAADIEAKALRHGSENGEVPVTVAITQRALKQLEGYCYSVLDAEIGGVLLGEVERGDVSNAILVQAVLPVKTDDYGPVHFTFSADSWALLHQERAEQYPNLDIIGWYHTHPGLGVFYSADDVVVHSAAFVMPWHVGFVLDPIYREGCWFGWRSSSMEDQERELAPISGYFEIVEESSESVATWKLVEAKIWDTSYTPESAATLSDQVYVPANDWPALPPISPWWGVLLGGVSLMLVLLLLLDRLIALAN